MNISPQKLFSLALRDKLATRLAWSIFSGLASGVPASPRLPPPLQELRRTRRRASCRPALVFILSLFLSSGIAIACDNEPSPTNLVIICTGGDSGDPCLPANSSSPCQNTSPGGAPSLTLSPFQASVLVDDIPIAFKPASGPPFAFKMHYSSVDGRGNNGGAWPIGYRWSHDYALCVIKNGGNYILISGPNTNASFTWNGTGFDEQFQLGNYGKYVMEWHGANIVVRRKTWASLAMPQPGRAQDCPSCGTAGGQSLAAPEVARDFPPYMAWSAKEGWEFEPDGSGNRYRLAKLTGPCGLSLTFNYASNLLSHVTTADSNVFTFVYTNGNRLARISDPVGRAALFFYTTNNMLASVSDMAGTTFLYGYDEAGLITTLSRPGTNGWDTTTITYDGSYEGAITVSVLYPEGNLSRVDWNGIMYDDRQGLGGSGAGTFQTYSWGKAQVEVEDAEGRIHTYMWYDNGNAMLNGKLWKYIAPDGHIAEYNYNSEGKVSLINIYDPTGKLLNRKLINYSLFSGTGCPQSITIQEQDSGSNVLSETTRTYERDENGTPSNPADDRYRLASEIRKIDAVNSAETRYAYNTNGMMTEIRVRISAGTNDFLVVKSFAYASAGPLSSITDAISNRTEIIYDSANRIISASTINYQPLTITNTVLYSYDDLDRITNIVYPDGIAESWIIAFCGCGAGKHIARDGTETLLEYDRNQRVQTRTIVSTNGTVLDYAAYTYIGVDKIAEIRDAMGNTEQKFYNLEGEMVLATDKLGRQTVYEYDNAGRQIMIIYPDGSAVSNGYDTESRLIKVGRYASPDSTESLTSEEYGYDGIGRRTWFKDTLGNVTSNSYDLLGRLVKVARPDGSFSETEYDFIGNVVKNIGPVPAGASQAEKDAATTAYTYDALDRRISMTDPMNCVTAWEYDLVHPEKIKYVKNANNQIIEEKSYDPAMGWLLTNVVNGLKLIYSNDINGRVVRGIYPDASFVASSYDGNRLVSQISRSGNTTAFGFDALGRQIAATNAQGQVTWRSYDAVGNVISVTDPLSNTTYQAYDAMNRPIKTILPDGRASTNTYDALGRLLAKTGAGSVPAYYTYDALGRLTELKDGEGNVTQFSYDSLGRFTKKTYADGSFFQYGYNSRGWLTNRVDAMGRTTAYEYNNAGQLTKVDCPTDPDIIYSMDNLGRTTQRVDSAGTWVWTYDGESSRVLSEICNRQSEITTVSYSYATSTYDLASMNCGSYATLYSWSKGRLLQVCHSLGGGGTNVVTYSYLPNSDLLSEISNQTFEVHRSCDDADRLTRIYATNAAGLINSFTYTLDSVGRRTQRVDADNSRTAWGYDHYDQLISAVKTNSPNPAADMAYNYRYQYDEVGNRLHEDRGLLDLDGTFNPLNQLTHLGFGGKQDVVGSVAGTNGPFTVKVDGETAAIFVTNPATGGASFHGSGRVKAGTNTISIVSIDASTNRTEKLQNATFPPRNPQQFVYDLNGNMISDGMKNFTWDEENRLIAVTPILPNTNTLKLAFTYDAQSRRVMAIDYAWNITSNQYQVSSIRSFVYDGWNLISEKSHSDTPLLNYTNTYIWGQDLSGSFQGAGGIGGLLCVIRNGTPYFPCYDGNGNISEYVDKNGIIVAHREYDPFGNTVALMGSKKNDFVFWFSSKYFDSGWNLYYYGYRYYSPSLGRWLSRDPIGEKGFEVFRDPSSFALAIKKQISNKSRPKHALGPQNDPKIIAMRELTEVLITKEKNRRLLVNPAFGPVYLFARNNSVVRVDVLGLDSPGCDMIDARLESPCVLEACAQHDACYDNFNCSAWSWLTCTWTLISNPCQVCNAEAIGRLSGCAVYDKGYDNPDQPNYYCGQCGVFFDDPNSPHMQHSTN